MRPRNTIILAVILIALLGYVYVMQSRNGGQLAAQNTPSPTPIPLFSFVTDNATQLQLKDLVKNQTVLVSRQGSTWHMTQPKDSATDPLRIQSALGTLANLEATRVLTNVSELSAFGLITGTLEARVTMSDTTTLDLFVGNPTIDNTANYALKNGDKTQVYLIDNSNVVALQDLLTNPPYPPTATPTPLPTLTPTNTPTITPTPGPGTPSVTPLPSPSPTP
jgi:uncharacterized protein DUF4340